jgi:hypothetical protein
VVTVTGIPGSNWLQSCHFEEMPVTAKDWSIDGGSELDKWAPHH